MYTAYKSSSLIDCTGADPIQDAVLLVKDNVIQAVGNKETVELPPGTKVLDLGSTTLMPGLVDGHGHMCFAFGAGTVEEQMVADEQVLTMRAVKYLREKLHNGVTTMRNPGEKFFIDITARELIDSGFIEGPRLISAGWGIRTSIGSGNVARASDGPEAIRRAVRENIARGASFCKLFVTGTVLTGVTHGLTMDATECYFSREELRMAVDESNRMGQKVAAHCHGGLGLVVAVECGVSAIEHGFLASEEELDLMAASGTTLVATSAILTTSLTDDPGQIDRLSKARERVGETYMRAYSRGIRIVAGSDDGGSAIPVQAEVECLVEYGMKPMDALLSVTKHAAELADVGERTGTLEAGKDADFIAVSGNPLQDIATLRNIQLVVKAGKERFNST